MQRVSYQLTSDTHWWYCWLIQKQDPKTHVQHMCLVDSCGHCICPLEVSLGLQNWWDLDLWILTVSQVAQCSRFTQHISNISLRAIPEQNCWTAYYFRQFCELERCTLTRDEFWDGWVLYSFVMFCLASFQIVTECQRLGHLKTHCR